MIFRTVLTVAAASLLIQIIPPPVGPLMQRYVRALGGEDALRRVKSRVTDGRFDNGRGLKTSFRIIEEAPNKRTILIGPSPIESEMGSGRGYDGTAGWDKNFIGTGLRTLEGNELADLARDADLLRPLRLLDDCAKMTVDATRSEDVLLCDTERGARVRYFFEKHPGLLTKQETEGGGSRATVSALFDDYKEVDGVRLPFRTRFVVPNATITYTVESVRQNQAVDAGVFKRPAR